MYLLLPALVLGTTLSFAQNNVTKSNVQKFAGEEAIPRIIQVKDGPYIESAGKSRSFNSKAFGDTLYSQDFDNGIPTGYVVSNANQNNAVWIWEDDFTSYQGLSTVGINTINSTTASNGFMLLPSDFYNSPRPSPRITMDTWFTSPKITIPSTPGVFVRYQQFMVYCCTSLSELVLEISTDSISWDEYDASRGLPVNSLNVANATAVENVQFDVSASLANETEFWYRFRSSLNDLYFWMIDDVAFIEGPSQDIELSEEAMQFNVDNFAINPFYNQIPFGVFPPLPFSGVMTQNGWSTNTNVTLNADVTQTGFGLAYTTSINAGTLTQGQDSLVLTPTPRFVPQNFGDFQVSLLAAGDSIDQILGNETGSFTFSVGDSVYARDDNGFGGGVGPASYVSANLTPGGTAVGDRFGTMYVIEPRNDSTTIIPKSVTFRVSEDVRNIGVEIVPKIWAFDEDSATIAQAFGAEVASSFFPYTVTASDTSSFLTIPLNTGTAVTSGLDSGQYVVGWEVTTLPTGTTFEVLNDGSSSLLQPAVSNFVWLGHDPGWGTTGDNPGIRLNIAPTPVGIEERVMNQTNFKFEIYPNPNGGQFKLDLESSSEVGFTMIVRNMLGQTVHSELISVNGSMIKDIDLSSNEKGVYFVSLENETERLVKKVVLK